MTDGSGGAGARAADLFGRFAEYVDGRVAWSRLPKYLGIAVLLGVRHRMHRLNLVGTGTGAAAAPPFEDGQANIPWRRSIDGRCNDPDDELMGSIGSRFGRNVPRDATYPEPDDELLTPSPRVVSERLLARHTDAQGRPVFRPATSLNLLAAAWIQFEVHDWFSHAESEDDWEIPLEPGDLWPPGATVSNTAAVMQIARTAPDPYPDPEGPPTFVTRDTHWWDASQLYGSTPQEAAALRTWVGGTVAVDALGLPPLVTDGPNPDPTAPGANMWVGLAMLHALFLAEHNAVCAKLAQEYPEFDDQRLYETARLVVTAVIAKIHTAEWSPAILAHPTSVYGLRGTWYGAFGERLHRIVRRFSKNELVRGVPGTATEHHGVPYSLTEEFVAVYRMHPLIPEEVVLRSVADDTEIATYPVSDLLIADVTARLGAADSSRADWFYSFGRAHPGELSLHNYPSMLRTFQRLDGEVLDLATVDILRTRERGVPRYNEFRRRFRLRPAATFEELTGGDGPLAAELAEVYGDVERVDLMVGLYAEPKPEGFGFSETAFRVFLVMASRRLRSDRFFTTDFRPEIYTPAGMTWIDDVHMKDLLLRHHPELAGALDGVENPFAQWKRTAPAQGGSSGGSGPTEYVRYDDAMMRPLPGEEKDVAAIVKSLKGNSSWAFKRFHKGLRDAHAKAHGVLYGTLIVDADLPPELKQGLFAEPGEYPVIARFAATSGALRSDRVSGVRGFAVKAIGVSGPRCLPDGYNTQDLLFVTHEAFPFKGARSYRRLAMPIAWLLTRVSDGFLIRMTAVLRVLKRLRVPLPGLLDSFAETPRSVLTQTFFTSAAARYGDYVAKMNAKPVLPPGLAPDSELPKKGPEGQSDFMAEFLESNTLEYEIGVQLCTDLTRMPIENAKVVWPTEESPYRRVARLVFESQDPVDPERYRYGDDVLSFMPFRGLEAHMPLGSINRLKAKVYESSSAYRHTVNEIPRTEPTSEQDLPT